jgi:hypothetical protein
MIGASGFLPARPGDTDPAASVCVKDRQAEYLGSEITGGTRRAGDYATTP